MSTSSERAPKPPDVEIYDRHEEFGRRMQTAVRGWHAVVNFNSRHTSNGWRSRTEIYTDLQTDLGEFTVKQIDVGQGRKSWAIEGRSASDHEFWLIISDPIAEAIAEAVKG